MDILEDDLIYRVYPLVGKVVVEMWCDNVISGNGRIAFGRELKIEIKSFYKRVQEHIDVKYWFIELIVIISRRLTSLLRTPFMCSAITYAHIHAYNTDVYNIKVF